MKAKPVKKVKGQGMVLCEVNEATHIELNMPCDLPYRLIPVQLKGSRENTGNWSWNGNTEKPTLKPSILTRRDYEGKRCHSFVNDGMAQFLNDSSHEFAGQTIPLLDVD